jgi:hypothetical protein
MNPFSNEDCSEYFQEDENISENEFCAAADMNDKRLNCGLVKREILFETLCSETCEQRHGETILHYIKHQSRVSTVVVGLSSSVNYCDLDKPLVFTRVSAHKKWILNIMQMNNNVL